MRFLLLMIIPLYSFTASGKITGIFELRELYYLANVNKAAAIKFYQAMENINSESEPVMISYKGMSQMMMSRYAVNPFTKWSYFSRGKDLLEVAVKKDPGNAEIRFLRFCIQTNIPVFLNYHSAEETDKKLLIKEWHNIADNDLKQRIKSYLLQSGLCNEAEKTLLL